MQRTESTVPVARARFSSMEKSCFSGRFWVLGDWEGGLPRAWKPETEYFKQTSTVCVPVSPAHQSDDQAISLQRLRVIQAVFPSPSKTELGGARALGRLVGEEAQQSLKEPYRRVSGACGDTATMPSFDWNAQQNAQCAFNTSHTPL